MNTNQQAGRTVAKQHSSTIHLPPLPYDLQKNKDNSKQLQSGLRAQPNGGAQQITPYYVVEYCCSTLL
ncbi:hypothetical protein [Cardinium endosymbiont of Philonthus spinipes]|uniref:hypothetical protein n=1 Tax=Cardinium endosymbiont of Philonthus spinipes TaxID=3077941 RepID=UPI00313DCA14